MKKRSYHCKDEKVFNDRVFKFASQNSMLLSNSEVSYEMNFWTASLRRRTSDSRILNFECLSRKEESNA